MVPPDSLRYTLSWLWLELATVNEVLLIFIVFPEIEELPLCNTVCQRFHLYLFYPLKYSVLWLGPTANYESQPSLLSQAKCRMVASDGHLVVSVTLEVAWNILNAPSPN